VGVRLPDRCGYVVHVATPEALATTSVNATRANGGTRGREWRPDQRAALAAITYRIAAKRLRSQAGTMAAILGRTG